MSDDHSHRPRHGFRFYTVMITLVIVGIFLLLLANNDEGFGGLTTSAVKELGRSSTSQDKAAADADEEAEAEESSAGKALSLANEVEVKLTIDEIPKVRKEAKVQEMELRFEDLTTKISVNKDKLELNNLEEVTLYLRSFVGELNLGEQGISLDGSAKRLEVNGIALSSKGDIKLSFSNLDYESLTIKEIELEDIEFPAGNGLLEVAEKLTYTLEQDSLEMLYFNGRLTIGKTEGTNVELEGVAKGITVSGALLNLDLR